MSWATFTVCLRLYPAGSKQLRGGAAGAAAGLLPGLQSPKFGALKAACLKILGMSNEIAAEVRSVLKDCIMVSAMYLLISTTEFSIFEIRLLKKW